LGYAGKRKDEVGRMKDEKLASSLHPSTFRLHPFIWWTWHDLNVRPRPSQSRALIPLSYRSRTFLIFDLQFLIGTKPCLTRTGPIKNLKSKIKYALEEGTGVEPASDNAR
jgi:hypothetical protein